MISRCAGPATRSDNPAAERFHQSGIRLLCVSGRMSNGAWPGRGGQFIFTSGLTSDKSEPKWRVPVEVRPAAHPARVWALNPTSEQKIGSLALVELDERLNWLLAPLESLASCVSVSHGAVAYLAAIRAGPTGACNGRRVARLGSTCPQGMRPGHGGFW